MQIADSSCKTFQAIVWSKADTISTQRQVVKHNRAFDSVCPKKG